MIFLSLTLRVLKPMSPTTFAIAGATFFLALTIWLACQKDLGGWAIASGCCFAFMTFLAAIFAFDAMRAPEDYNPRSVDAVWRKVHPKI